MVEIKLNKRYKYAGDIMPKLLEIGFDLETACDFLNSIKDADVAPKSAWISVDERLPDKQAQYLIVDDEGYMEVALWTRQFGWFSHVNRGNKVTHWMPLPEPPKGE
jgi:hypothetical protein